MQPRSKLGQLMTLTVGGELESSSRAQHTPIIPDPTRWSGGFDTVFGR
jgi:hypothetical protein